jgi:hypothetical protein
MSVNLIHAGRVDEYPAKWVVTQGMIKREIAKATHSGENQGAKLKIGAVVRH